MRSRSIALATLIAVTLARYSEETLAYGLSQWAFCKRRSSVDLTTMLVLTCLLAFHEGSKIGLFLSDIAGAFNRADTGILRKKLRGKGLSENMLTFIDSYLQSRKAYVLVSGSRSAPMTIGDMVFQGTVLGPPL